jgi:NAD(P)-dependent dehydrogenase (short-subunit alcohol dehydrogenase family)
MDLELRDKVIVVTGGTDGLGRALCQTLVDEGASVAFCGRDAERLASTAADLETRGGTVLGVQCDVTKPEDLARLVTSVEDRFGRLDGLVNNAGRAAAKRVEDTTDDDWTEDLDLKLFAAIRLTRLVLPLLRASSAASIINVLAISGKAPGAGTSPTSVARAAGLALTKALSKELGPQGIRVNAVLIGLIESGQWERLAAAVDAPVTDILSSLETSNDIPLGRVGRSAEFADLGAYLLSARSSYVTGTAINLDGGLSPAF